MQPIIQLHKVPGSTYQPDHPKVYEVKRDGLHVGYVTQDITLSHWRIEDRHGEPLDRSTTIKAATRKAHNLLTLERANPTIPASWVLAPCDACDGEGYIEVEEHGGRFNVNMEQWYPRQTLTTCHICNGAGVVEVLAEEPHMLPEAA